MVLKRVVTVVQAFTIAVALLSVALLVLRQPPAELPARAAPDPAGALAAGSPPPDGKAIYLDRCAACHGDVGEGTYAPAFKGGALVQKYPNVADQRAVIMNGVSGTPMKAFGSTLSAAEIQAVLDYTRTM